MDRFENVLPQFPTPLMDYDLIDPTGVAGLLHLMGLVAERVSPM